MGIAAVAMAASVFAADVSAKVKLTGSLFNLTAEKASAMKLNNHASHNWEPDMALSASDENAGAAVAYKTMNEWGSGEGETTTNWNIWFKPMDAVKVNIGNVDVALNKETIDWSSISSVASNGGYGVEYAQDALFVGAYLDMGWGNAWLNDKVINKTSAKIAYSADFGTISGLVNYQGGSDKAAVAAKYDVEVKDGAVVIKETPGTPAGYNAGALNFGLGYSNAIDSLSFFVDVIGNVAIGKDKADFASIIADAFVAYSMDALTVKAYVSPTISLVKDTEALAGLNFKVRVDYKLDSVNVFAVALCNDITEAGQKALDNGWLKNPLTFKAGLNGSVGMMGWECRAEAKIATKDVVASNDKFRLDVPVEFTVNF